MTTDRDPYIFPLVVRSRFALGGKATIIVQTRDELVEAVTTAIDNSPPGQVTIERMTSYSDPDKDNA